MSLCVFVWGSPCICVVGFEGGQCVSVWLGLGFSSFFSSEKVLSCLLADAHVSQLSDSYLFFLIII